MFRFLKSFFQRKIPERVPMSLEDPMLTVVQEKGDLYQEIEALKEDLAGVIQENIVQALTPVEQAQQIAAKALRRIHLILDQQSNLLKDLQKALQDLPQPGPAPQVFAPEEGLLTREEVMALLDIMQGKVSAQLILGEAPTATVSANSFMVGHLLSQLGWNSVAEVKEAYHPTDCEILEAVENTFFEPGTVLQVVQQGYRDSQGKLLRRAKVIVARMPEIINDRPIAQEASGFQVLPNIQSPTKISEGDYL